MATSYTNYLGSGPRLGLFNLKSDFSLSSTVDLRVLIEGSTSSGNFFFNSQDVTGKSLTFQIIGSSRVVDGFKIYQATHTGTVAFKFQGWDGTSWTDLHSFNWPTASGTSTFTFTNTTAYRAYRFLGVSGTISNGSVYEIEFSTDADAAGYETGNRGSLITVTASGITSFSGTNVQSLVDGSEAKNTTNSWYPNGGQTINSSSIIKFALAAARTFVGAKIRMSSNTVGNNGRWKWQGSNDNSTWTDVSDTFLWDFAVSTNQDVETDGAVFFTNPGSYSYYRLVGVSGLTSGSPWYMEVLFDNGTVPAWPAPADVASEATHILSKGTSGNINLSSEVPYILSRGVDSHANLSSYVVHVLTSLKPAGELSGDTNAGIHHDVTQWGGSDEVEPIVLEISFEDDFQLNPEINTNVANPFVVKFFDDFQLNVIQAIVLRVTFEDDFQFEAFSQDLTPIPPVQSMLVTTGRKLS